MTQKSRMTDVALALAFILIVLAMFVLVPASRADDKALYGPDAPPGSAFIRVFNASGTSEVVPQVGNDALDEVDAWEASEFGFVPAGQHAVRVGGASRTVTLAADRYYTAVADGSSIHLIENEQFSNRLKALIILYNLTDEELSLKTSDGSVKVIEPVAQDSFGQREVNPARVQLAVYNGVQKLASAPQVNLARGKAFSLFAVGNSDAPRLVWASN